MPASGSPCRSRPTRPTMLHVGMAREEPDQLGADVPGGADDRDPDRVAVQRAQAVGRRGPGQRGRVERTVRRDRRARRVRAHRRADRSPAAGSRARRSGGTSSPHDYTCALHSHATRARRRTAATPARPGWPPPPRTARGTAARTARRGRSARRCVPRSTIRPRSNTRIRSARRIVDRRWAIAIVVRPSVSRPSARLDQPLADGVERGRRLVEDQDPRVLEQHPRDRDPLLLAARQLVAALADDRVVAVGHLARSGRGSPPPGPRRSARRPSRRASRTAGCRGSTRGTGTSPGSRTRSAGPATRA